MHRGKYLMYFVIIGILVALAVAWKPKQAESPKVESFEECARAGYPVMESYPRQCSTPDGRLFVEPVNPER